MESIIQNTTNEKFTDFHTHILPGMDDGARDVKMSVEMLCRLKQQGVDRVCLTPHYINHREPVKDFLARREESLNVLTEEIKAQNLWDKVPELIPGAEVAWESPLEEEDDIALLCYKDTDMLLLELPFERPDQRTFSVIENIAFKYNVKPVIAHLDRYVKFMDWDQLVRVINLPGAVLQFNYCSVGFFKCGRLIKRLREERVPVVFGSDCHNLTTRPPKIKPM